jgi:Lrp/AsnC family transcriptional regulator, regulator for asnA, asnC and gidA
MPNNLGRFCLQISQTVHSSGPYSAGFQAFYSQISADYHRFGNTDNIKKPDDLPAGTIANQLKCTRGFTNSLDRIQNFRYKRRHDSICSFRKQLIADMHEIDSTDREIVNLLIEDGRMQAAEIARRLGNGVSERTVRYRIQRLIDEKVIHIGAVPNPHALGYQVVADVFLDVEPGRIEEVARTLAAHELVSYVAYAIGERDISVQVVGRTNTEIYNLTTETIGKLPGVRRATTSIVPRTLKDIYQWRIPSLSLKKSPGNPSK